jgi:hypothetical protein
VVIGPCPDGGYYLIGLSKPVPDLFREMPWSTARVLGETGRRVERLGLALSYLPDWHDVDTAEDLDRLVRALRRCPDGRAPRTTAFCRHQFPDRPVDRADGTGTGRAT